MSYEQPQIEVFDIQLEKGFAQSNGNGGVDMGIGGWGTGNDYGGSADWE